MGTETSFVDFTFNSHFVYLVKLNNPLMGTETNSHRAILW